MLKFAKARLSHTTGKNRQGEPRGHQKYYMKLAKRYYGPFQILQKINETSYRLKLPTNWHIHNAFHVSLLKPYKGDPPTKSAQEEPPDFDEQEEILWPEEILRHEDNKLRSGKIIHRFLIRFRNYPPEDAQWMQETQLKDHSDMLQAFNGCPMDAGDTIEGTYEKGDNIQKYVDKFWDLHLKALVFKDIDIDEQHQQFCAGLPEDV